MVAFPILYSTTGDAAAFTNSEAKLTERAVNLVSPLIHRELEHKIASS
jgi:hypothetical protein